MTDFLLRQIEAEARVEAARQALRLAAQNMVEQINQRVAVSGLPERHELPGEIADRIAEAGLSGSVLQAREAGAP